MSVINLSSVGNSGAWTRVGAATDLAAVNDPIHRPDDTSYMQVLANTADAQLTFGPNFPTHYTAILDYGDGHAGEQFRISRFTFRTRMALQSAGTVEINYLAGFFGATDNTTFTVTSVAPNYTEFTKEYVNSPTNGLPFAVNDIIFSFHALQITAAMAATNPAINLRVSRAFFISLEGIGPPNAHARIGPNLSEPALYCAICSYPFHLRDLIKVEDARHPMVGRWVCRDDYDEINPEPRDPIVEGDIDFDL